MIIIVILFLQRKQPGMNKFTRRPVIHIPELSRFECISHGFGTRCFNEQRLRELMPDFQPVFLNQIHSDIIIRLNSVPSRPPRGDACLTAEPGLLMVIQTADCLPLLLFDPERKVAAAGHCGWKGTAAGLAAQMAAVMAEEFGCTRKNIIAALGPCIGPARYQVGDDVRKIFREKNASESGFIFKENRLFLDLKQANREQLLNAGVRKIYSLNNCTFSESEYYSYRRNGVSAGRMLSYIGFKAEE